MEMIDATGTPRRDEELVEAREAIKRELVTLKNFGPILVYYLTIINAIDELLERRRKDIERI
ncbi:MAG TPA: hypothetical protein VMX17_11570 [Candidatus Glassbacteria bacterium]|nr:hypothetical protein [Candidatus Glassbacteria bacterium]